MGIFDSALKNLVKVVGGYDETRKAEDEKARQQAEKLLAEAKRLAWLEADTGDFAESYFVKRLGHAQYEVQNSAPYARYVEEGRSAGKRPPGEALRGWAERHGFLTGKVNQDRGKLYVLARSIGRRGIAGKHILDRAKKNLGLK